MGPENEKEKWNYDFVELKALSEEELSSPFSSFNFTISIKVFIQKIEHF